MLSRLVVGHTPICECHVAAITKALQKAFCSLNISSKPVALVSAALLTLDFASTSVVSAATASTYLAGEVALPFPDWVGTAIVFLLFVCISLSGFEIVQELHYPFFPSTYVCSSITSTSQTSATSRLSQCSSSLFLQWFIGVASEMVKSRKIGILV